MAGRRTPSRSRRRRSRDLAAERWLLLLGLAVLAAFGISLVGPWPADPPTGAEPLTMAAARASNAAVPIVAAKRLPALPYHFRGGNAARAQAVDCLATAALYEAGDDRRGQRAVMQVVLNRLRAPGFPKTVCGVVYAGAARATGCQFSFTCDRSIQRRTIHDGWGAARRAARRALDGATFRPVGRATHYHADWMVPYWRDTLVKIGKVGPHLFYVRG